MKLDELIMQLQELQKQGYGEKNCIFDDCYSVSGAKYDAAEDYISVV
jgi:hypothetical protein